MRKKVSTVLDETLYRRVKLEAARTGKQISQVLTEALEAYLREQGRPRLSPGLARESFGALQAKVELVQELLSDEEGLFGS